ncbi:MAG: hypothetical protein AAFR38_10230 [Planctomycetota bacterium]
MNNLRRDPIPVLTTGLRVEDDAGELCNVASPFAPDRILKAVYPTSGKGERRRQALGTSLWTEKPLRMAIGTVGGMFGFIWVGFAVGGRVGFPWYLSLVIGAVVLWFLGFSNSISSQISWSIAAARNHRRGKRRNVRHCAYIRACLIEDRCPCCSYELATVEAEGGKKRCPECGAVWDVDLWKADHLPLDWKATIGHSRGSRRKLHKDARRRWVALRAREPWPAFVKIRAKLLVRGLWWRLLIDLAVLGGGVGAVWSILTLPDGAPAQAFDDARAYASFAITGLIVYVLVRMVIASQLATIRLVRRDLGAGVCPCCGAALARDPSPVDGAILCETCGAAWPADAGASLRVFLLAG